MIRYWPAPSVTAVRTFSISTGLAASTMTPGSTAPDESRTTPAIEACAYAAAGVKITATSRYSANRSGCVIFPPRPVSLSHRAGSAHDTASRQDIRTTHDLTDHGTARC